MSAGVASRTLDKQRFDSEQDLVTAIKVAFASEGSASWVWLSELESPNGIADLVAVRLSAGRGASPSLGHIPPRWAYALKCLPYRSSFTLDWFAQAFCATTSYARGILQLYASAGFCHRDACDRSWSKIEEPRPIAEKIVAVEAKLRDWRKALYQATRYLDYAAQSWVVLDRSALSAALPHVDGFWQRGIGLMGLGRHGELEVVSHARNRTPRMIARFWHVNTETARRVDDSFFEKSPVEAV